MKKLFLLTVLLFLLSCQTNSSDEHLHIGQLLCEYNENPIGIDTSQPQFNWILKSNQRGQKQTGYRLLVAATQQSLQKNIGDMWDIKKISSNQTNAKYSGKTLQSNKTYYWKLQVWDKEGKTTEKTARFETSLLQSKDWQAKWIGQGKKNEPRGNRGFFRNQSEKGAQNIKVNPRSVLLRKEFKLTGKVKRAKVFVSGLGLYELIINGKRVGDKVLNPAKTNYLKEILYDVYAVNDLLIDGSNALGIHLGNGWFNPLKKWWSWRMQWFGSKRALLQMEIEYTDGKREIIISDNTWKTSLGPVLSSCIYDGEQYDATQEQPGWDKPGFDDSGWEKANEVDAPRGKLISQLMPAIKVNQIIKPLNVTTPEQGIYVFDMGQNFSGWARLKVNGTKGTKITLKYAENIARDGMIDNRSMNLANAEDSYILKGEGEEIYEPHFTYRGFRYVEIHGFPGTPTADNLSGCVVHSSVKPVGRFECDNPIINRLHKVILWSQRNNLMGFPTDCPQRDERLGWLADAYVTSEEAMNNFDMFLFYRNWLSGIKSNQDASGDLPIISPRPFMDEGQVDWGSGYILLAWYDYQHYGDKSILEEHFDNMEKYLDFLTTKSDNYILPKSIYGDWVSIVQNWKGGDPEATSTAFFYYDASVMSKIAKILNKKDKVSKFTRLKDDIGFAYNKRYFNKKTIQYEKGSQFSNAFPLYLNIVPTEYRKEVLQNLINDIIIHHKGHLTTGILGTKYMVDLLARENRNDIVYLLVTQRDYPSWYDLIKNRTTLSERWDQGGSNNHVMFGSIDDWFYRTLAGINLDENNPAYRHIIIKPFISPDLSYAKASINTFKGKIVSHWTLKNGNYNLHISIPVNSYATVYIPAEEVDTIKESGKKIKNNPHITFIKIENKQAVFKVASGKYNFSSENILPILGKKVYTAMPDVVTEKTTVFKPRKVIAGLNCVTKNSVIHYTLDGTDPHENSPLYDKELTFDKTVILKAKAFTDGLLPSFTKTVKFSFVDPQKNGLLCEVYQKPIQRLSTFKWINPSQQKHVYQMKLNELTLPGYDFVLRYSGYIIIEKDSEYTFYSNSNDGSHLYIDNKLIVNNDEEHGAVEKSGKIYLKSGIYPIKLLYFQSGGSKKLEVSYKSSGGEKNVIPASVFLISKKE